MRLSIRKCLAAVVCLVLLPFLAHAHAGEIVFDGEPFVLGWGEGGDRSGWRLGTMAYEGEWGAADQVVVSQEVGLVARPWAQAELHLDGGLALHSVEGPGTETPRLRTYGAELGMRSTSIANLQSELAFWWLEVDSDLRFVDDFATSDIRRGSQRYGIEWTNRYSVSEWLDLAADLAFTRTRFRDADPASDSVPSSPSAVIGAGATVHDLGGFFGDLRLRYYGMRPGLEEGSARASSALLLSAQVGYEIDERWTVTLDVLRLFDRGERDVSYDYASRAGDEPAGPGAGGFGDIHFHSLEPLSVSVEVTATF